MEVKAFADRVLTAARAAGIDPAEVSISVAEAFSTRVRKGAMEDYQVSDRANLVLRGRVNGRIGMASTRAFDEESVDLLIRGVIESAVVGVRKPDPAIFMLGVVALGLEPRQVLVVGDSLRKDILPARSIGCHTAWIKGRAWSDEDNAATHPSQVADLHEIAAAIATR